MGKIQVNNIKLYAYHGCLEEEAKIGSWYRVNVEVEGDLAKSALTDDLSETIDYVHLNRIVKEEMESRSKLLESVVQRILDRFFDEISILEKAQVSIAKLNPPIGGNVEEVLLTLQQTVIRD